MSASAPQTKLRLDRSRTHSTIHGERPPGDAHQYAQYQQDGIFYDAHGLHIDDLVEDDKTRALVDRRLARQMKAAKPEAAETDAGDGDQETGDPVSNAGAGSQDSNDVNLEAWLRGEAQYQWFSITKLVRERYHQNITKKNDMIEFLIEDEKVIPVSELAPEFAALLKQAA